MKKIEPSLKNFLAEEKRGNPEEKRSKEKKIFT